MEYTDAEKQILSLMERVNFKNLSKNDVLIYTSKLNELRPEVARQAIAQFPELADMIKSARNGLKRQMLLALFQKPDAMAGHMLIAV